MHFTQFFKIHLAINNTTETKDLIKQTLLVHPCIHNAGLSYKSKNYENALSGTKFSNFLGVMTFKKQKQLENFIDFRSTEYARARDKSYSHQEK